MWNCLSREEAWRIFFKVDGKELWAMDDLTVLEANKATNRKWPSSTLSPPKIRLLISRWIWGKTLQKCILNHFWSGEHWRWSSGWWPSPPPIRPNRPFMWTYPLIGQSFFACAYPPLHKFPTPSCPGWVRGVGHCTFNHCRLSVYIYKTTHNTL